MRWGRGLPACRARPGAIATLAFALLGCGGVDDSRTDSQGYVHGVVTDADTGKGVGGAKVRFVSDTLDEATDTTSKSGAYRLMPLTDTAHGRLEITKTGYETRLVSVYLDGEGVSVDVAIERE